MMEKVNSASPVKFKPSMDNLPLKGIPCEPGEKLVNQNKVIRKTNKFFMIGMTTFFSIKLSQ